jgi:hypothetical protein
MKIAISQPAYLPWLGYFDLMDQVDVFVLLDSVQFARRSWQQRNRIKTPTGLQWLTVPVVFRGHFGQRIQDVAIREPNFSRKHLRAIELNYRRAPFFERYYPEIADILQSATTSLVELNERLIRWFNRILNLQTRLLRSSRLQEQGARGGLLMNICKRLGADFYLSPIRSAVYLLDDLSRFEEHGIGIGFQHYEHPEYRQLFPPFQSHGSVLDLIFNEGDAALPILRRGRRPTFPPAKVAALTASGELR